MSDFDKLGFMLVGDAQHEAYVRLGKSKRALIFIAGFNQPAESWYEVVRDLSRENTIAVIVRRQENRFPSRFLGWQTIGQQRQEVIETILLLKRNELAGLKLTLVGHSVGAMLARHCLSDLRISTVTDKVVQICPVPLTWWDFTFHLKFWLKGGLLAAPFALLALLCVTRGLSPPRQAVQGLFTGKVSLYRFDNYYWTLVHDSALVFLQLVISHNELKEWKKTRAFWHHGHNVIVGVPNDPVISESSVMRLIQADMSNDELHWFAKGTPHCFWMSSDIDLITNLVRLRKIIEG